MNNLEKIRAACIAANPEILKCICDTCKTEYGEYVNGCVRCSNGSVRCGLPRPIRLADVLLVLTDKAWAKEVLEIVASWNLRKDSLEDQSEPTLTFIASLL